MTYGQINSNQHLFSPVTVEETIENLRSFGFNDDAEMLAECYYSRYHNEESLFQLLRAHQSNPDAVIKICKKTKIYSPKCIIMLACAYYRINDLFNAEVVLLGNSNKANYANMSLTYNATVPYEVAAECVAERCMDLLVRRFESSDTRPCALALYARICNKSSRHILAKIFARAALAINPFLFSMMDIYASTATKEEILQLPLESHLKGSGDLTKSVLFGPLNSASQRRTEVSAASSSEPIQRTPIDTEQLKQPTSIKAPQKKPLVLRQRIDVGKMQTTMAPLKSTNATKGDGEALARRTGSRRTLTIGGGRENTNLEQEPRRTRSHTTYPMKLGSKTRSTSQQKEIMIIDEQPIAEAAEMEMQGKLIPVSAVTNTSPTRSKVARSSDDNDVTTEGNVQSGSCCKNNASTITDRYPLRTPLYSLARMAVPYVAAVAAMKVCETERGFQALEHIPERAQYCLPALLCRAQLYYDTSNYNEASNVLRTVRELYPWSVRGAILYSTVLWQQQLSIVLSQMSIELRTTHPHRAETWVVIANTMALGVHYTDHERAIKALHRAIELNPELSFAHVLLGHEYLAIDKLPEATEHFGKALVLEPRSYNAYCGRALVHYKEDKFQLAVDDYRQAVLLNSSNPTILAQAGTCYSKVGKLDQAFELIEKALAICPSHVPARYHKAQLHFYRREYEQCAAIANQLVDVCMKEANIYMLLGKCYKAMGMECKSQEFYLQANDHVTKGHDMHTYMLAPLKDDMDTLVIAADEPEQDNNDASVDDNDVLQQPSTSQQAMSSVVRRESRESSILRIDFDAADNTDETF